MLINVTLCIYNKNIIVNLYVDSIGKNIIYLHTNRLKSVQFVCYSKCFGCILLISICFKVGFKLFFNVLLKLIILGNICVIDDI